MVLEKTLESPLDSKEIKPINPKWIFTGKTDAKVDAPILWPPDANSSLEKTLRKGKIEGRRQVGDTGWDGWMALLEETLVDSEGQGSLVCCSSWGCRVGHNSSTKQQYQSTECINALKCFLKAQSPSNQGIVSTMAARDHWGWEGAEGRNNLLVRLTPPGDPAPKSAPLRQLGLFLYLQLSSRFFKSYQVSLQLPS